MHDYDTVVQTVVY